MKIQEITQFIFSLRKTRKKMITNYYLTLADQDEDYQSWTAENSIVFCARENKVYRCYFATTDTGELNTLLEKVPDGAVMDYVTKQETGQFPWVDAGFSHYTTLRRCTVPSLSQERPKTKRDLLLEEFYDEGIGDFATDEDAEELYDLLYEVFDYRVSRLPSKQQLLEMIAKNWVLLYRENGEIISFLMYQIEGKKYYGYQIYNKGTADITYNLQCKAMKYAVSHYQVKSSYAWVEIGNQGANDRVGDTFDGTYDYIFLKEELHK